jgi:hypothetical protein
MFWSRNMVSPFVWIIWPIGAGIVYYIRIKLMGMKKAITWRVWQHAGEVYAYREDMGCFYSKGNDWFAYPSSPVPVTKLHFVQQPEIPTVTKCRLICRKDHDRTY